MRPGPTYNPPVPTLALDTSTGTIVVGVVDGSMTLAEERLPDDGSAAQRVLVAVDGVLHAVSLAGSDLDRVVVGLGPGSFTATRIGIATASALAAGWGIPVAGSNGLAALRAGVPDPRAIAVVDARRGEVFAAGPSVAPGAYSPEDLAALAGDGTSLLIGDGACRYRDRLGACGTVPPDDDPRHVASAQALVATAHDEEALAPCYLRDPDARPQVVSR